MVADLPGVGENLQDHLEIYVQHACTRPITLYSALKPLGMLKGGALVVPSSAAAPEPRTSSRRAGSSGAARGVEHPDLQYHFIPIAMRYDGSGLRGQHGFQAHVGPMRPESRGRVRIRSADPHAAPSILFNYLSTERDRRELRDSVHLTREIFAQAAFDPWRGEELAPGPDVRTDDEINAFVRKNVESAFHPSGTCRMGTDERAVTDGETRVHGTEGLAGGGRLHHAGHRLGEPQRPPPSCLRRRRRISSSAARPRPPSNAPVWNRPPTGGPRSGDEPPNDENREAHGRNKAAPRIFRAWCPGAGCFDAAPVPRGSLRPFELPFAGVELNA